MATAKMSGIYEIVNTVNGKRYVGSALKLKQRWNSHVHRLRRGNHHSDHLQSAWLKYGEASFVFRVLEHCGRDVLLEREQHHIDQGCDYNKCMVAGSPLGVKHSRQSRLKMSEARRGKAKTEEWRLAAAQGVAASWADPDVRSRRSEAIRKNWQARKAAGYKHPELTPVQNALRAERAHTPELIAARKARMAGSRLSDEHRAAISAGNKGRVVSVETRQKISRSLKARGTR